MTAPRNQRRVLEFLARQVEPVAGIEVADALGGLARSSAYAALAALQRDGLVSARWDVSASHPRRLVRITALGRRELAREAAVEQAVHKPSRRGRRLEGTT